MIKSQLFYIYNYTMVKVGLFCGWCCVCCIVLLTLCCCGWFLLARHDHNKIAPCGMIKVFDFEFERSIKKEANFISFLQPKVTEVTHISIKEKRGRFPFRVQELCESRGGRPGFPS